MISHKYKFVCLALPRCCSTTLAHILKPVINNHIKFISNEHRKVEIYDEITNKKIRHANITHFINLYGEKILKDYYKFCVIRNPWDRIISFVSHLVHEKGTSPFEKIEIALDTYSDWINIYPHISYDDMPTMDKYILYDNFAQEMKEVLEKLCVPYDEVLLHKRINKRNVSDEILKEHRDYHYYFNQRPDLKERFDNLIKDEINFFQWKY